MNRFDLAAKDWDNKPSSQLIAKTTYENLKKHILLKDKNICDYGCGSGLLSLSLSIEAKYVLGLDSSSGMVEVFNEKVKNFDIKNMKAKFHNIEKDEFETESFDIIVTTMTLHHIKKPELFFQKCKDGLKKGGYLCILDLDKEDGSFHRCNADVKHFGFSKEQITNLYKNENFKLIFLENVFDFQRENGIFPLFLSIGQKR